MNRDSEHIMFPGRAADEGVRLYWIEPRSHDGSGSVNEFDGRDDRRQPQGVVERRKHTRYAIDAWAEVMVKDGTLLFRGRVLDISLGGCYVETEARLRLAPGTPVEMIFRMDGMVFRPEAMTRMVRPGQGAGFLFGYFDAKMQRQLEMLIEKLSGEPV